MTISDRDNTRFPWLALAALPVVAGAAWIVYSKLAIDHDQELPAPVPGDGFDVDTPAGRVHVYASGAGHGTPLLLVHSVNAAASAYEVRPLYEHYAKIRPVYALDLPGFGHSERADRIYEPRQMVDALQSVTEAIQHQSGAATIDLVALSLSCEFAARAVLERPAPYGRLALISPTGFDRKLSGEGRAQSTKGSKVGHAIASFPPWSQALYDFFVSRPSMRFFLNKTFGSPRIDEGLFEYDQKTAHRPGAQHVVWSFLSGFLFANDVSRLYRLLELPVWAAHGTRGDFVDYRYIDEVSHRPNWTVATFETGAFPHFEQLAAVTASLDRFFDRSSLR